MILIKQPLNIHQKDLRHNRLIGFTLTNVESSLSDNNYLIQEADSSINAPRNPSTSKTHRGDFEDDLLLLRVHFRLKLFTS